MLNMKFVFFAFLLIPALVFAQVKPRAVTKKNKKTVQPVKPADSFLINGDVKGYPEGTKVFLLNGQTGAAENEATLIQGKFSFIGKQPIPEFKIVIFNNQPPYITIFLDNSTVNITGSKETIEKAVVKGSKSHTEFEQFNTSLDPYKAVFDETAPYDSVALSKAILLCGEFAIKHPDSYITPLAIIRFNQIADDPGKTEILYNALAPLVKTSPLGGYIAKMIEDNKKNAIGTPMAEFSQTDTSGTMVSLSSFRGKYLLIDFWASWCGPCRQENPNVLEAFNKYKNKNFTILGVSLDKAKPAWIEAIAMDNLAWTHVSDLLGWNNAVAQQFQIQSIPQNFLLDPEGRIIGKNLRGAALERKLAKVLR